MVEVRESCWFGDMRDREGKDCVVSCQTREDEDGRRKKVTVFRVGWSLTIMVVDGDNDAKGVEMREGV
jgi:hypothetical protein